MFLIVAFSYSFLVLEDVSIINAFFRSFVVVNKKLWNAFLLFFVVSVLMSVFSSLITAPIIFSSIDKSLVVVDNVLVINSNSYDRLMIISLSLIAYIPYYLNYFSISFWYLSNVRLKSVKKL